MQFSKSSPIHSIMISAVTIVARYERIVLGSVVRSMSTKVALTPEEIKQGIERAEKLRKFMLKPGNKNHHFVLLALQISLSYVFLTLATTNLAVGVGSGADLHVPKNIAELAALSGMPAEHASRTVLIGQRPLKSTQSGQAFAHQWQITWKNAERWTNPLMGWSSSADPMAQVKVTKDLHLLCF